MKWKDYLVTFWAMDGHKSWLYVENAPDAEGAKFQARLRHAGLDRPKIDPTRTTVKEK